MKTKGATTKSTLTPLTALLMALPAYPKGCKLFVERKMGSFRGVGS